MEEIPAPPQIVYTLRLQYINIGNPHSKIPSIHRWSPSGLLCSRGGCWYRQPRKATTLSPSYEHGRVPLWGVRVTKPREDGRVLIRGVRVTSILFLIWGTDTSNALEVSRDCTQRSENCHLRTAFRGVGLRVRVWSDGSGLGSGVY